MIMMANSDKVVREQRSYFTVYISYVTDINRISFCFFFFWNNAALGDLAVLVGLNNPSPRLWHKQFSLVAQQRSGATLEQGFLGPSASFLSVETENRFQIKHCPQASTGTALVGERVCVDLHVFPVCGWVFSGYFLFLWQSKNKHVEDDHRLKTLCVCPVLDCWPVHGVFPAFILLYVCVGDQAPADPCNTIMIASG